MFVTLITRRRNHSPSRNSYSPEVAQIPAVLSEGIVDSWPHRRAVCTAAPRTIESAPTANVEDACPAVTICCPSCKQSVRFRPFPSLDTVSNRCYFCLVYRGAADGTQLVLIFGLQIVGRAKSRSNDFPRNVSTALVKNL